MIIDIEKLMLLTKMDRDTRINYLMSLVVNNSDFFQILKVAGTPHNFKRDLTTNFKNKSEEHIYLPHIYEAISYMSGYTERQPKELSETERLIIKFIEKPTVLKVHRVDLEVFSPYSSIYQALSILAPEVLDTTPKVTSTLVCSCCGSTYDQSRVSKGLCVYCKSLLSSLTNFRNYEFTVEKNRFNIPKIKSLIEDPIGFTYKHWVFENTMSSIICKPIGKPEEPLLDEPLEFLEYAKRVHNLTVA